METRSNKRVQSGVAALFLVLLCLVLGIKGSHFHSRTLPDPGSQYQFGLITTDRYCPVCDFTFGRDADISFDAFSLESPKMCSPVDAFWATYFPTPGIYLSSTRGPPSEYRR